MTGLEVTLIIIGFVCICVSSFVARKHSDEEMEEDQVRASAIWTEKDEEMIRERVNVILSNRQNELVDSTEEQLNRICNEKIMAVDEFSKPLLEKIESNHQEVVFMYNMLNEKQKDIKKIMAESVRPPEPVRMPEPEKKPEPVKTVEPVAKSVPVAAEVTKTPQTAGSKMQTKAAGNQVQPKPAPVASEEKPKSAVSGSVNLQIQKMYKEGKSILEISKELNIGQGEVKLVIALYGGRKS